MNLIQTIGTLPYKGISRLYLEKMTGPEKPTPMSKAQEAARKYSPLLKALSSRGVSGFFAGKLPNRETGILILTNTREDKERLASFIADRLDGVPVAFAVSGKSGAQAAPISKHEHWAAVPDDAEKAMDRHSDDVMALVIGGAGVNGFGYGVLPDENGKMPDFEKYEKTNAKPPLGIVMYTETKEAMDLITGFLKKSFDGIPVGVQAIGKIVAY